MKRLGTIWPYIITIIVFNILFFLTTAIDNRELYLGFGQNWHEVETNNKLPLQEYIFVHGLTLILVVLTFFEKIINRQSSLSLRVVKGLLSLFLIYFLNGIIYRLLEKEVICLYHHHRGTPAIMLWPTMSFSVGLVILFIEGLLTNPSINSLTQKMEKYIPSFIRKFFTPIK